jgi:hypothetical protein
MALTGCGLDGSPHATVSPRHVLLAPASTVQERIKTIIERKGIGATDFYPTVLSMRVIPITPGVLYRFDARTRISTLGGPRPGHFQGTYHRPSDSLKYTSGVPSFALGRTFTSRGGFLW